ncbi:hypothetical protein AVEN_174188-1 [Araneus ventricosus]|uniref:Uncharacterized protein n=1 Tax=Araneus ventricosus TaxID=182803 RepID=A0A4Y2RKQ4_ARAVE|nr:hypothetical protein AVEN_174188-1 [Araneus ventricosus]
MPSVISCFCARRSCNVCVKEMRFLPSRLCKMEQLVTLMQKFWEDKIISRRCRFPWTPNLAPVYLWLWGYLKYRVYRSGLFNLSELKDTIRREVSYVHPDLLHSAVAGFVTRVLCVIPCGGDVEHVLL